MIALTFAEAARPRVVTPPGWTLAATQLVPPGGGPAVEIRQVSNGASETLEEMAARAGRGLAEELPGYAEQALAERSTRRGVVLVRSYQWRPGDGAPRSAVQVLGAGGALATVASDEPPSDDLIAAVAEAVAAFAFGAPQGLTGVYSVEELTALAELGGASSFPGTGEHAFESDQARQAARRALIARGSMRGSSEGKLEVDPLEARMVATAIAPDAVVAIEERRQETVQRCLVYAGGGLAVAHSAGAQGLHRLEAMPAVLASRVVRSLARAPRLAAPAGDARAVDEQALQRLREESSTVVELVPGDDAQFAGGRVEWLETEHGIYLVGSEDGDRRLVPASGQQIGELLDSLCAPLAQGGSFS